MKQYLIADLKNFYVLGEYHTHKQAMKYLETEFAGWDFSVCTKKQFADAETKACKDTEIERMSNLTHFTKTEEKQIIGDYDLKIAVAETKWEKDFLKRAKEDFIFRDYNL